MRRTTVRRLAFWTGILAIVAGAVWLAVPLAVTAIVERRLNDAGFAEVAITHARLGPQGVAIERLSLAPGETLVLEDVRLALTASRITGIAVERLILASTLDVDGNVAIPGYVSTGRPARDLVDLVPDDGLHIGRADIRLDTAWGPAAARFDAVNAVHASADLVTVTTDFAVFDDTTGRGSAMESGTGPAAGAGVEAAGRAGVDGSATVSIARGGTLDVALDIASGRVDTGGFRADGLAGAATLHLEPAAAPAVELGLSTDEARAGNLALGPLRVEGSLRDDLAELSVRSMGSDVADLAVIGSVRLTDGGPLIELAGRATFTEPARGDLAFELAGVSLSDEAGSGRLQLAASDLVIPGLFEAGSLTIAGVIEGNREQLRLESTGPWAAAFVPADELMPASMQALAGEAGTVTIVARDDGPLVLDVSWSEASAGLDARFGMRLGQSRVDGAGRIAASWADALTVTADSLTLEADNLPYAALTFGLERFEGQAGYRESDWNLTGRGTVHAAGSLGALGPGDPVDSADAGAAAAASAFDFAGLTAQWSGSVSGTATAIAVSANECIDWNVAQIDWQGRRIHALAPPCLQAASELLVYDRDNGRSRFALSTAAAPLGVRIERTNPAGLRDTVLSGTWPALNLTGAVGGAAGMDLSARLSGGAATIAPQNVAVEGLDAAADIRAGLLQSSRLTAASIESLATPAWWAPLNLEASAEREAEALAFQAFVSDALGTFIVEASGRSAAGAGSMGGGQAEIMLYPVQFISGATAVADISPLLAEYLSDASGMLAFEGMASWGPAGVASLDSEGRLRLDDFGATIVGVPVAGVTTAIELASLWPPVTLPEQQATIARISLGVPLENGRTVFDVDADGRLTLHSLAFEIAGGSVSSDAFTVDSAGGDDYGFTLLIEGVELSQMLALSKINGVQGTGILSGSIPVRMAGGELALVDGRLAAIGGGTLRYTPTNLPAFLRGDDQRTRMLREVLTNFQYDALSITVSGNSGEDGQQRVRFEAEGANPDFLDGHPIELAFTFQGPLLGAMSSAVSVAGAAEIEDMFEQEQLNNLESTQ